MDSPFDLGLELAEVKPSSGLALVIAAQTRYAAYCRLVVEDRVRDALPVAKQHCRQNFIRIADEIYNRIPEDHR